MTQQIKSTAMRPDPVPHAALQEPILRVAEEGALPVDSSVRLMHERLELAMSSAAERRWSPRRSVAFMLLTNGLFWAGLIAVAVGHLPGPQPGG